ncbi:hypothetical protein LTR53_016290 [Teratosphaeriaceae sp. CCFEE 6253]|nr:hypothetical protein LTR53_016290 [Teratosphaeriaceae sp. CCFEE 6253]
MAPRLSASSRAVRAEAIDATAFAAFGSVIQNPATHGNTPSLQSVEANQGSAVQWLHVTEMRSWYSQCQSRRPAQVVMNMFVSRPRQLEQRHGKEILPVRILERHPFTPQTFVPLGLDKDAQTCYLVIVAPTLPLQAREGRAEGLGPARAYPVPPPRRKRTLRERLLGARPNLFTNDFLPSTTPSPSDPSGPRPRGPGLPDLDHLRAFVVRGDQSVTYGPGTWHAPMVVLGPSPVDFVVTQYKNGVALEDCQEVEIDGGDGDGVVVDVSGSHSPRAKL